ncbi:MAG: ABC transporter permease subunit [Desulfobacterota bacterium]|nr:ABC transporter permease subunit [Thermodesulfobacteriota bacterium]
MLIHTIARRELKAYFTSLIAYTVIATFLAVSGYFFYTNMVMFVMFVGSDVRLGLWQQTFYDMRFVLVSLMPLLTMRLFAEEKKLGTIELLFTSPLQDVDIILGKYLASVLVLVLMLVLTVLYPILLAIVFSVDIGPVATGYLGLFLMGSACIACGLFLSSLTENQIVAAMATLGVLLLLWFIDWNEGIAGAATIRVLHQLSFSEHFLNFIRGVIELDDVVYYVSLTVLFLCCTAWSLESRKWRGRA